MQIYWTHKLINNFKTDIYETVNIIQFLPQKNTIRLINKQQLVDAELMPHRELIDTYYIIKTHKYRAL